MYEVVVQVDEVDDQTVVLDEHEQADVMVEKQRTTHEDEVEGYLLLVEQVQLMLVEHEEMVNVVVLVEILSDIHEDDHEEVIGLVLGLLVDVDDDKIAVVDDELDDNIVMVEMFDTNDDVVYLYLDILRPADLMYLEELATLVEATQYIALHLIEL